MKNFRLTILLGIFIISGPASIAQSLCTWDYEGGDLVGQSQEPAALPNSNAYIGAASGGINATPHGLDGLQGFNFPTSATEAGYYQVQVLCPLGNCDLSGFAAIVDSDGSGPTSLTLKYSTEIAFANPTTLGTVAVSNSSLTTINLPAIAPNCTRITLRMYPTQASSILGSFYVDQLSVNGSVAAPLPATLINFAAKRASDNSITVNWATASEQNVRQFNLESSEDGKEFHQVDYALSKGKEDASAAYQLTVSASSEKAVYLRLTTEDFDGSISYSDIVFIAPAFAKTDAVKVVSNTGGTLILNITGTQHIRLVSTSGQVLVDQVLPEGEHTLTEFQNLPPGLYVAAWDNGTIKLTKS